FNPNSVPRDFVPQFAPPLQYLTGMEHRFTKSLSPVRSQGTVSRSGNRIFWNSIAGSEIARYKIRVLPRSSHRHSGGMKPLQPQQIGPHRSDLVFRVVRHEVIVLNL